MQQIGYSVIKSIHRIYQQQHIISYKDKDEGA